MLTGPKCGMSIGADSCEEEEFQYDPGPYCVVNGSPLGGFHIHGPFDDVPQAVKWAEERAPILGHCTVMPLNPPS